MWNTVSVHIPENVSSGSHLHVMPYIDKAGKLLANAARGEWGCVSDLKGLDKRLCSSRDPVDPNFNYIDVTC